MKKVIPFILISLLLCASCANEFNAMYKTDNFDQKYEYAKQCYLDGKYTRATLLLQQVVTLLKGTDNGQECLFMLAMANYKAKDYETAAEYFKKYYTSYPRGTFAEQASFHVGQSLYESTPEPRLDQTPTMAAIAAFQEYLDLFPDASIQMKESAHKRLFEL